MLTTACRRDPKTKRIEMTVSIEFSEGSFSTGSMEEVAEEVDARKKLIYSQVYDHLSFLRTLQGKEKSK